MKRKLFILVLAFLLLPSKTLAAQQESKDWYESMEYLINDQLNNLDVSSWEPFLKYIQEDSSGVIGKKTAGELIRELIAGKFSFTWQDIFHSVLYAFFYEFQLNLMLMAKIIGIAVLCSILRSMADSFQNSSVGEVGYFVCYSVVIILIIQSMISVLTVGKTSVDRMSGFMQILFPILLGLLTAMGNFASVAVMQPAVGVLVGTAGSILSHIVFPLISLSAVITIVNHIGSRIQLHSLGKLLNNLCIWVLSFVFTIFIGVLTIQGAMTASFDGISIRTAKFAMDTFVPIVGKMLSQSLDAVIGCSLLLKNAVGTAGFIIIGLLSMAPAVKIFTLMFLYKLSGSLLEPITDKRIADCLNGTGNVLLVLLVTVLGIALMFFLTTALMIAAGNTAVMLR